MGKKVKSDSLLGNMLCMLCPCFHNGKEKVCKEYINKHGKCIKYPNGLKQKDKI